MVPPRSEPRRIASLVPGATELLYVLGGLDRIVAVSHECDFPPAVSGIPRVTRSRVDPTLPAAQLDARVKEISRSGESLYELDLAALQEARPELLIVQGECEACSVSPKDVERLRGALRPRPEVDRFGARTWEQVLAETRRMGKLLNRPDEAKREILKQWGLAKEIRRRVEGLPRPRVAVLDWLDPPGFAGHWTQELVEMAGGEYGLVAGGQPSRLGSWDELEEYEPDVIVAAPCGRGRDQAADELATAVRRNDLWELAAVQQGRLFAADGNRYFNRPGPRLIYSAAILARALHWDTLPQLPDALESGLGKLEVPRSPPGPVAQ